MRHQDSVHQPKSIHDQYQIQEDLYHKCVLNRILFGESGDHKLVSSGFFSVEVMSASLKPSNCAQ